MTYIDGAWIPQKNSDCPIIERVKTSDGWVSQSGFRFLRAGVVKSTLPPDIYRFIRTDQGMFFEKQFFPTDIAASLPGLPSALILDQIKMFWEKAQVYKDHGLLHKRGILLYGSPGCGKTSIIRLLCNDILDLGGIVFTIDDFELAGSFISEFRSVEPNRPVMTIMEDIEGFFDGSAGTVQLKAALSFLDGQDQTNNVVNLATTNEPEKLADRFIKRPGRFDLIIGIHAPGTETRDAYLRHVDPSLSDEIRTRIVEKTEGLPLAYLREVMSSHVCLGVSLEDTLVRLKHDASKKVLKNKEDGQFGFTVGYDFKRTK